MGRRHAAKPPPASAPVALSRWATVSWRRPLGVAWLIAAFTLTLALATLGPTSNGPGLTVDEFYDAAAGKRLVHAWRTEGWQFFRRDNVERTFGTLTLHPPLGRWILGWVHHVVDAYPDDAAIVWLPGARAAAALALAALVGLVGSAAAAISPVSERMFAAGGAATATALMPRLFAHGHLATLDLFAALFFFAALAALLSATRDWSPSAGPRSPWIKVALAGALWGLALASKISGLLLLPAAGVWLVARYRAKGAALFVVWMLVGYAVLLVLWPWLWFAPVERTARFLFTATDRATLHTFYWGQVWDDRATPWHYPWIVTAVTVPAGILVLAIYGAAAGWREATFRPAVQLTLLALGSVLLTFSWPGVPVYDGERLFLMVYPLVGLLCGVAVARLAAWAVRDRRTFATRGVREAVSKPALIRRRVPLLARLAVPCRALHCWASQQWHPSQVLKLLLLLLFAAQGVGIIAYHPFQLSYYNLLVGGLGGAARLGFEVTYWGDTVDHTIANIAAQRATAGTVLLAPHLAPFQAQAVEIVNPSFEEHGARVVGWPGDSTVEPPPRYLLVYNRRADPVVPAELISRARLVAENRRQGVWLARLYELGP